jgi:import inner membrane translocase subunit TIM21
MRFWVHGRGIDKTETLGWLKQPLRDLKDWAGMQYDNLMEQYLMDRLDEDVQDASSSGRSDAPLGVQQQQESGWFGGLFGALKPNVQGSSRGGSGGGKKALPPAGTYTSGEARADFVKVCVTLRPSWVMSADY